MNNVILTDTSLCAIVRDEIENPAGGIVDFVNSTLPFVESGVIVDTGSVDGTREKLEELSLKYHGLKIYDRQFDDYSSSRNFSLNKVETKMALILDADERLTIKDFENLKKVIGNNPRQGYNFEFYDIYPEGIIRFPLAHNPRLFKVSENTRYRKKIWEVLYLNDDPFHRIPGAAVATGIAIKHFLSFEEAMDKKYQEWYNMLDNYYTFEKDYLAVSADLPKRPPSKISSSKLWKAYNPQRDRYR
ncbi:MAG: glycosyltransferase [Nanoarchaeota archaeon]|nr:glycosyltransferase [Nanoarchaeota archaeon]